MPKPGFAGGDISPSFGRIGSMRGEFSGEIEREASTHNPFGTDVTSDAATSVAACGHIGRPYASAIAAILIHSVTATPYNVGLNDIDRTPFHEIFKFPFRCMRLAYSYRNISTRGELGMIIYFVWG